MEYRILTGKQCHLERELYLKRIQDERNKYIMTVKGCSHLPLFQLDEDLETCGYLECVFEMLMHNVYICPNHFTVHVCHSVESKCLVAWNGREHYCRISCRDLHQDELIDESDMPMERKEHAPFVSHVFFSSGVGWNGQRKKNNEEMYTRLYRKLKYAISHTVSLLSNIDMRNSYNKAMAEKKKKKKRMSTGERDFACEILISRDIYKLAQFVLENNKERKEKLFLLRHVQSFAYILFTKCSHGLCQNSTVFLNPPPYMKAFNPLPKKTAVETFFHISLKKMSKCVLIIQSTFERMNITKPFS